MYSSLYKYFVPKKSMNISKFKMDTYRKYFGLASSHYLISLLSIQLLTHQVALSHGVPIILSFS